MNSTYFPALEQALRQAGRYQPTLVIDRDRLDRNIARLMKGLAPQLAVRIVDKSLPSLPLLRHVLTATGAMRIMSFHLPITQAVLEAFPHVDVLFGKPMPAEAVEQALTGSDEAARRALTERVVWLMDSRERLEHYAMLAARLGLVLRIAFEVDVGMHRGGIGAPEDLQALLQIARASPALAIHGLMGYEAHIPKMPRFAGGPSAERATVSARLDRFTACLAEDERRILNTGGSKTLLTYDATSRANDVSVGSALLLPSDFDTPGLPDFEPAVFICTPALKVVETEMPGPAMMSRLFQRLGLAPRRNCYLYGGAWMARPVYPEGLSESRIWGRSSNQQFLAMSAHTRLEPSDFVFLRPTQSEAVLQQFGPIRIYSQGQIVDQWEPLPIG